MSPPATRKHRIPHPPSLHDLLATYLYLQFTFKQSVLKRGLRLNETRCKIKEPDLIEEEIPSHNNNKSQSTPLRFVIPEAVHIVAIVVSLDVLVVVEATFIKSPSAIWS